MRNSVANEPKTGWVTLKKEGVKLVSSRLRLDSVTRAQYQKQWHDRVLRDKQREREQAAFREAEEAAREAAGGKKLKPKRRSLPFFGPKGANAEYSPVVSGCTPSVEMGSASAQTHG